MNSKWFVHHAKIVVICPSRLQFTVAEEPERNLEIIDGFARDAAVGDREADLITAELSRECLDSARRTLPVLQNRRFADPQLCD